MAISTIGTDALAASAVTTTKLASGVPSRSQLPAGTVLQVVNATYSTQTSTSSSTYADTGLTATITPTSATSKILVIVNVTSVAKYNATYANLRLVRNSTPIFTFEGVAGFTSSASTNGAGGSGCTYLDSPATTSATTYKAQFASQANVAIVYINDGGAGAGSSITLMEIAA